MVDYLGTPGAADIGGISVRGKLTESNPDPLQRWLKNAGVHHRYSVSKQTFTLQTANIDKHIF